MGNQIKVVINFLSVLIVLFVNYYSQTGKLNGKTIGELSDQYQNLFTPAGFAFSIWGIIFLLLIVYVVFQLIQVFFKKDQLIEINETGYWFAIVNLGNASWVIAWLYEYTILSVFIMLTMLVGLVKIILRTEMGRRVVPFKIVASMWWPIAVYCGWIAVATVANISALLAKLSFDFLFTEIQWTIIMMVIAAGINLFMVWKYNLKSFALVGVWALYAIYKRHELNFENIAWFALLLAVLLMINIVIVIIKIYRVNPNKSMLGNT